MKNGTMEIIRLFSIVIVFISQTLALQVSKDSIYSPVFTHDTAYLTTTLSANPGVSREIIDSIKYTDTNGTVVPYNCNFTLRLVLEGKTLLCAMGLNCEAEHFSCKPEKTDRYAKDTLQMGKPKSLAIAEMGNCVALCPLVVDMCPCHGCPNKVNSYGKLTFYSKNGGERLYLVGTRYQCAGNYENPLGTSAIRRSSQEMKNPAEVHRIFQDGRLYLYNKDVTGKLNREE